MKKLIMVMAVAAFCLSIAGIAGAVDVGNKPGATMQQVPGTFPPPVPIFACPAGWHNKPNASMTCIPNKPAPITCPTGYQYFEQLTCTGTGGLDYCRGCEVGCFKPPEPPK